MAPENFYDSRTRFQVPNASALTMSAELAALREGLFEQGTWQDTLVDQCYSRSTPSGLHPPPPPPVFTLR